MSRRSIRPRHEGAWWDPCNPDERWPGVLTFDDRKGVALDVSVESTTPQVFPPLRSYDLLLGMSAGGARFTLIDCWDSSTRGTLHRGPRPLRIRANAALVGLHSDSSDPVLSELSVSFPQLADWGAGHGFRSDLKVAPPNFEASYAAQPATPLYDDGALSVSLEAHAVGSLGRHRVFMRERIAFRIAASTPRKLSELQPFARACGDLLSIACLVYCGPDDIQVVAPAEANERRQHGSYHAVPFYRVRERRGSFVPGMLFRFTDLGGREQSIFDLWFSKLDKLQDALALYTWGVYGRGFIEQKLLALTQAVEAFHRRLCQDRYMDQAEFERDVFEPLVSSIPGVVNSSHRTSLRKRLQFANEFSFRTRLRLLFKAHGPVLRLLVSRPEAFIGAIVETRNEFTHFPLPTRQAPTPRRRHQERVLLYNWLLRLLLESCFLTEMGFTCDEIRGFVGRSNFYQQLADRLKALTVE